MRGSSLRAAADLVRAISNPNPNPNLALALALTLALTQTLTPTLALALILTTDPNLEPDQGEIEISVQTMKAELGPTILELRSSFVQLVQIWDGDRMVNASEWHVRYSLPLPDGSLSDTAVSMSEFYATEGPDRCYRLLQMHMDMPFGYLVAALSSKKAALKAA